MLCNHTPYLLQGRGSLMLDQSEIFIQHIKKKMCDHFFMSLVLHTHVLCMSGGKACFQKQKYFSSPSRSNNTVPPDVYGDFS